MQKVESDTFLECTVCVLIGLQEGTEICTSNKMTWAGLELSAFPLGV